MNQRERTLAIVVGGLVLLVGAWFAFDWWDRRVADQRNTIAALDTKVEEQEQLVRKGNQAVRRLENFRRRSLPGDANVARSLYRNWLLELAVQDIKLSGALVTPGSSSPVSYDNQGVTFHKLSYSVRGQGTLEQLTDLLLAFYSVDFLHKIRTMEVKPIPESRMLDITLGIDAVVVAGAADDETLRPKQIADIQEREEIYKTAILGRNIFAPANRPPDWGRISSQRITTKDSLSLDLKAADPDPLDKVTFELGEGAPAGASLDRLGKLRFRSREKGSYQIPVVARDDGVPSASSAAIVSVSVVDPPPMVTRPDPRPPKREEAHFEDGQFAFITAITEVNGRRQFWLNDRTTGETSKLHEGDKFEIKRLRALVTHIGLKEVELTSVDERRRFELGENLAQGEKLAASASGEGE